MDFGEAFDQMMKRKVIRRRIWQKGMGLAFYHGELWYTMKSTLYQQCHKLSEDNILACDWEVSSYDFGGN